MVVHGSLSGETGRRQMGDNAAVVQGVGILHRRYSGLFPPSMIHRRAFKYRYSTTTLLKVQFSRGVPKYPSNVYACGVPKGPGSCFIPGSRRASTRRTRGRNLSTLDNALAILTGGRCSSKTSPRLLSRIAFDNSLFNKANVYSACVSRGKCLWGPFTNAGCRGERSSASRAAAASSGRWWPAI